MNKESAVPLYYQLREILLQNIEDKTLKVGDQIPSERELELKYGLSRTTVRRAVERPARGAESGLIAVIRGRPGHAGRSGSS